jgi:hypothetical protein
MPQLLGSALVPAILDAGYGFDFIDDGVLANTSLPHRILILPNVHRIPLASLRKIGEYIRKGGTVVVTHEAPSLAPGLQDAADAPKIAELSRQLFAGRIVPDESQLAAALHKVIAADVAAAPEIGFLHRHLENGEVYFLANTANHPVHTAATFRVAGLNSAWWDPYLGTDSKAGGATLDLDLAPYESRVVVFSKDRATATAKPVGPASAPLDLTAALKAGRSWTEDEALKYFSGQRDYEASITVPQSMWAGRHPLFLNFGEGTPVTAVERRSGNGMRALLDSPVREAAVVYVNGKRAGAVWHAPYEVEVGPLLHPGINSLRIVVANLAINHMAKGPLPDYKALNARYGERFQPQDMNGLQPLPSGLLGPVKLLAR